LGSDELKNKSLNTIIQTLRNPWWLQNGQTAISHKIVKDFTEFCCKYLPISARKFVFYVTDTFSILGSRLFFLICQLNLTAYLISGKEKHSGENVTILFLSNENSFSYLPDLIFSEEPQIKRIEKIHIWNISKKLSMILDISEPFEKIYNKFNKSAKEDIRKVKRYNYTYEISRDLDKLKLFYNHMYVPYTYSRHGKLAICANFFTIRHLFERGSKLMLIKLDNKYIFGSLFFIKKDMVIGTHAGIMDEQIDCLKKSMSAASYYFSIIWAKENGAKFLDFGTCRPFLNDGLFQYKKKWGAAIEKANGNFEIFAFKTYSNDKGMQSFLENNPFIRLNELHLH
jgi:lipid II:glycine glycyltransferase (peptidoglycan interpeptide bridge formation enzyme)